LTRTDIKRKMGLMSKKKKQSDAYSWEQQFRAAIEETGWPLMEITRQTGVDHSQLSRFMRGERGLSITTAERVAAVVGLELKRVKRKSQGGKR